MSSALFVYDDFRTGESRYKEIGYCVFGFQRFVLPGFILVKREGKAIAVPETYSQVDGYLLTVANFIDLMRLQVLMENYYKNITGARFVTGAVQPQAIHLFAAPSMYMGDRLIGSLCMSSMR